MKRVAVLALLVVLLLAVSSFVLLRTFGLGRIQGEIVTQLASWFGDDVALERLSWSLSPSLHLRGEGLRVGAGERPLIRVSAFEVDASLGELFDEPRRVRTVRLEGLDVYVSRRERSDGGAPRGSPRSVPLFVIDEVLTASASVAIASKDPEKLPRVYEVRRLRIAPVDPTGVMRYEAFVRNPTPAGDIHARGSFGPWDVEAARDTPIRGDYLFENADMSTIRGLEGTLSSEGTFEGSVAEMSASGRARIPEFALTVGDVVPLDVEFETFVGDKGGDIRLEHVDARFLSSRLLATGAIVRSVEESGRRIEIHAEATTARVEDLVRFAVRAEEPPLSGDIALETRLIIPPGPGPVLDRMEATGRFEIDEATFGNLDVQKTLARVSRVTGGDEIDAVEASGQGDVVSNFTGHFEIDGAVIRFSELGFSVPGMDVDLVGSYHMREQTLDMRGRILTERRASEMAPGAISKWLAVLDPFLGSSERGVSVPISIRGHRSRPKLRPDWGRLTDDWKELLEGFLARP